MTTTTIVHTSNPRAHEGAHGERAICEQSFIYAVTLGASFVCAVPTTRETFQREGKGPGRLPKGGRGAFWGPSQKEDETPVRVPLRNRSFQGPRYTRAGRGPLCASVSWALKPTVDTQLWPVHMRVHLCPQNLPLGCEL